MNFTFTEAVEVVGTFSFAVSGALAAMSKKLDPFGVLILAFATAIGGGTVRDLLLGVQPVTWLTDMRAIITIIAGFLFSLIFSSRIHRFTNLLNIFDALGLGFFTLVGIDKAMGFHLPAGICVALGTITGCFGGVLRDVLLNNVPQVFRKEIYASASIVGGIIYFISQKYVTQPVASLAGFSTIVVVRILAIRHNLSLPTWYKEKV